MTDDTRLAVVEQQYNQLSVAVPRLEEKIDAVQLTLQSLVRIEERQIAINSRLAEGAQTLQEHGRRVSALELALPEKLNKRLMDIETKLPSLLETRRWVVLGVLGVLGMVGAALANVILK